MQPEHGHKRKLKRHNEKTHHEGDEKAAPGEIHPGERVRGESGDQDRNDRRRDRHRQCIYEGAVHVVGVQYDLVVIKTEIRWLLRRDIKRRRAVDLVGVGVDEVAVCLDRETSIDLG